MAAILIFFPGRNRPRLETSAETGRGMAQGGAQAPLAGGAAAGAVPALLAGAERVAAWGEPFPAPAFPLGETGKGDQIPRCRRQFVVAPTACTPLLSFNQGNSLNSLVDAFSDHTTSEGG